MIGKSQSATLDTSAIIKLRAKLDKLSLEERTDKYQLKPDRADVIVPAMDIYLYILNELKCTQINVPKIGLSDGMIYAMHKEYIATL
jgi:exopolyphosphatase/guanosine-5'-triphosphate,3'-diphosphate pyrophosphatase